MAAQASLAPVLNHLAIPLVDPLVHQVVERADSRQHFGVGTPPGLLDLAGRVLAKEIDLGLASAEGPHPRSNTLLEGVSAVLDPERESGEFVDLDAVDPANHMSWARH